MPGAKPVSEQIGKGSLAACLACARRTAVKPRAQAEEKEVDTPHERIGLAFVPGKAEPGAAPAEELEDSRGREKLREPLILAFVPRAVRLDHAAIAVAEAEAPGREIAEPLGRRKEKFSDAQLEVAVECRAKRKDAKKDLRHQRVGELRPADREAAFRSHLAELRRQGRTHDAGKPLDKFPVRNVIRLRGVDGFYGLFRLGGKKPADNRLIDRNVSVLEKPVSEHSEAGEIEAEAVLGRLDRLLVPRMAGIEENPVTVFEEEVAAVPGLEAGKPPGHRVVEKERGRSALKPCRRGRQARIRLRRLRRTARGGGVFAIKINKLQIVSQYRKRRSQG